MQKTSICYSNLYCFISTMNKIRILTQSTFIRLQKIHYRQSQSLLKTGKEFEIKISQACVDRLNNISSDGQFLRVIVDGGGCSGFQYRFELDSNLKEDDECFEKGGAKVVVDKISLPFLKGSTIDFQEELIRSAFRIADNPQADSRCSCGSSFSIKLP